MLQNSNAIEDGGYVIARSLRFNSASSTHVSRVPSVAGNRRTWTYSTVIKRGALGTIRPLLSGYSDLANKDYNSATFMFDTDDTLHLSILGVTGAAVIAVRTLAKFRDPSAHYHVVLAMDTTQATNTNGVRIYVNGVLQALTFTAYTQNQESNINNTTVQYIGAHAVNTIFGGGNAYSDGYMSEVNFIDGQALTPSSFGEINSATGQWVAKKYTGTYGTNGFYLDFKDGTSTTTLGYDKSGNNNHWTLTNFTRSAGVNDCWMLDVPAGNGSASSVQPSGNYAVLNPLASYASTKANGNLNITGSGAGYLHISSISLPTTGKYYFEASSTSYNGTFTIVGWFGVCSANLTNFSGYISRTTVGSGAWQQNDVTLQNINFGSINSIFGVAVDRDNNTVQIYLDGVLRTEQTPTLATGIDLFFVYGTYTSGTGWANFGQRSFAYTPPTGFKALCTANLPTSSIKKPSDHFNIQLSTGANIKTDAEALFTNELEWIKDRANTNNHQLIDSVRGSSAVLQSNTTAAETTYTAPSGSSVGWVWRASDSAPVSNTSGSITSQVSANTTAGFSVVTWSAQASAGTVGHGLGIVPKFIIMKSVPSSVGGWFIYTLLGSGRFLLLNSTVGVDLNATVFTDAPTSAVFSPGSGFVTGNSYSTMVAYCFAEIAGYSKFGSYTGNGSADGPFVYTGFKPRFVMFKRTNAASAWVIYDASRDTDNPADLYLQAQSSAAEASAVTVDINSNGFKLRTAGDPNVNGGTYIYMTFAESPFQYSNAR